MVWGEWGKPFKAKVKINISYNRSEIQNLNLEFKLPFNIIPEKSKIYLESLTFGSGTPYSEIINFYVWNDVVPSNLDV